MITFPRISVSPRSRFSARGPGFRNWISTVWLLQPTFCGSLSLPVRQGGSGGRGAATSCLRRTAVPLAWSLISYMFIKNWNSVASRLLDSRTHPVQRPTRLVSAFGVPNPDRAIESIISSTSISSTTTILPDNPMATSETWEPAFSECLPLATQGPGHAWQSWGYWSGPCIGAMPALIEAHDQFR